MNTLTLPAHFLTVASHWHQQRNPYRNRVEVGGYLVANPATPDTVAFATGPGKDATHAYAEVGLCRYDIEPAVEAAGYKVIGDWHTHPVGLRPSDTDKQTWLGTLKDSTLERWYSVILVRDEKRWSEMAAWSTYWRDGGYRLATANFTPGLTDARVEASDLSWMVNRSSLLDQAAWIKEPYRLHQDLCLLDMHVDLFRRTKVLDTNKRLKRLGFRELTLSPLPAREVVYPGEVIDGGQVIRRTFTPPKITIR